MSKKKPLKMDCERCQGKGEEPLGEGLHKATCHVCKGKSEVELTELQLEIIKEYLKRRANGLTHAVAILTMAQDQAKEAEDVDTACDQISKLIDKISIANVEEIRQFMAARLKEIQ